MKQNILKLIGMLLGELALAVGVFLLLLFMQSYAAANLYVFQDFSILQYANGLDILWMTLYLSGDALFFLLLFVLATEAVLWMLRTMLVLASNGLSSVTGKEYVRFKDTVKKVSFFVLLNKLGIKTAKSGIIFYVVLMLMIFALPFGAQKILEANTSFVYRVYVGDRLYSEETLYDMSNWVDDETSVEVSIAVGYGNIHLYTLQNTTEAKIVVLYDREADLNSFTLDYNETAGTLDITGNLDQETYDAMSDALIPQIEVYLPAEITLSLVELTTIHGGDIVLDYVSVDSLVVTGNNSDISINATNDSVGELILVGDHVQLNVHAETCDTMTIQLLDSTGTLLLRDVSQSVNLTLVESQLDFFSTKASSIQIDSTQSTLNLIEVYATTIHVSLDRDDYRHSNSSSEGIDEYIIVMDDANVHLKGVTCDFQSPSE